jgi:hypothetical protein
MFDAAPNDATQRQTPPDPMIEVAERHMRMLQKVEELAMEAATASQTLVVATAMKAAAIVRGDGGDWACEADKARSVHGHTDAADAFNRITRALRLTMALEAATAERLRDLYAGVAVAGDNRAGRQASRAADTRETLRERVDEAAAEDGDIDPVLDLVHDLRERLFESDRFGPLLRRPLLEVVGLICGDIGVVPDWSRWSDEEVAPDERSRPGGRPSLLRYDPELAEARRRTKTATDQPSAQAAAEPPAPHRRQ